jgi:hypothetical protein
VLSGEEVGGIVDSMGTSAGDGKQE